MGRPIKKKWFLTKAGSEAGNLALAVGAAGTVEAIIKQVGTGVYQVASGRVKLVDSDIVRNPEYVAIDPAPGIVGTATLTHNGREVLKINQYRMSYADDDAGGTSPDDDVWRDGEGVVIGTLVPGPIGEVPGTEPGDPDPIPKVQATGTVVPALATDANTVTSVTIDEGGSGYAAAPPVTFSDGDGGTATGTATMTADVVSGVTMTAPGSYLDSELPITVTFGAP